MSWLMVIFKSNETFLLGQEAPVYLDPGANHTALVFPCGALEPSHFVGAMSRLTREEETLFTPVTLVPVTAATVGVACFAFKFFTVGLLRTDFITVLFKPRGEDRVFAMSSVDVFLLTTII